MYGKIHQNEKGLNVQAELSNWARSLMYLLCPIYVNMSSEGSEETGPAEQSLLTYLINTKILFAC